jgi:hypothetical protein
MELLNLKQFLLRVTALSPEVFLWLSFLLHVKSLYKVSS